MLTDTYSKNKQKNKSSSFPNDFYFKHLIVEFLLLGFLIIGSGISRHPIFIFLLLTYITINIIVKEVKHSFGYLLLLVPNLGVLFLPGISAPLLNILIPVALLKTVFSKEKIKFGRYLFVITFIIIIYEVIHAFNYTPNNILTMISWVITIIYVLLVSSLSNEQYDHSLTLKYFLVGIFISGMYGLLANFDKYGAIIPSNQLDVTNRFNGAAGDPNYFSLYILVGLFCMLRSLNNTKSNFEKVLYLITFTVLPLFAFMSLSRMFILVLSFVGSIYLFRVLFSWKKYKGHRKIIAKVSPLFFLLFIFFFDVIVSSFNLIVSRFTMYQGNLTLLTSNRNLIMERIIDFLAENPIQMLFGVGIQGYGQRIGNGMGYAHNIILEMLAAGGILGTILFCVYFLILFLTIKESYDLDGCNRKDFINYLPLLALLISYIALNAIEVESFYLLLLFVIIHVFNNSYLTTSIE